MPDQYDDGDAKFEALQKVGKDFRHRHGREPSYWLDKACIDQRNIADGLRVLALNVVACNGMLVLCGETYIGRLCLPGEWTSPALPRGRWTRRSPSLP